jgi:hypothetical protein
MVTLREAQWLSVSAPDCCPVVPGSKPASPQPTADCRSSGGLPPGMALNCELTSVRGDRGENYEIWTTGSPKTYEGKKYSFSFRTKTIQYTVCLQRLSGKRINTKASHILWRDSKEKYCTV